MKEGSAARWRKEMRESSSRGAAAIIAVAVVAALVAGVGIGWGVSVALRPGLPTVDEIAKISVVIDYGTGASQYLGSSPANGCAYENCPIALNQTSGIVTLNLALLSDLSYANFSGHSATVSSVSSSPAGITTVGNPPILLASGSIVWTGIVCSIPSASAAYSVTVVVTAT